MDERTDEWMENLPILQDFVPYQGRCPKSKNHNMQMSFLTQNVKIHPIGLILPFSIVILIDIDKVISWFLFKMWKMTKNTQKTTKNAKIDKNLF